jgi:RecA-family ATPase
MFEPNSGDLIRAAQALWGEATNKTKTEWRFGQHGSKSIDLVKLTYYDHQELAGGGVLDLLKRAGLAPEQGNGSTPLEIAYPYEDAEHHLLRQVVRRPGHKFVQRRPDPGGNGAWVYDTKGVPDVPYRLPELVASDADDVPIFIPEGEKDVDNLRRLGLVATCNAGGAGKWKPELNGWFRERAVVILPDNDEPGRKHADQVAAQLLPIARSVLILVLPGLREKGDVSDWIDAGGTREELLELVGKLGRPAGDAPQPVQLPWLPPFVDGVPAPAQEWAIRDRIPNQQVALFSGHGSAGKSTIALHLCAAHALGRDWLQALPEPGPAWLIDCEDGPDVLHRRLEAVVRYYATTFAELYAGGLRLMSLAGQDSLLATADRSGLLRPTPFYAQLLAAAAELRPKLIAIASLSNVYGGIENDRAQVQQFIALLRKIAIVANGAVLLIGHPSLEGIKSNTGISGSTAWHNAVRARWYLKGVEPDNGDEPDTDLRSLEFRKNQYGPQAPAITLRFKDGLFLPEGSGSSLDQLARASQADEVFLTVLRRRNEQSRWVADNPAGRKNYAPRVFCDEPEARQAKLSMRDLAQAMERLFRSNRIRIDEWGPVSKRRRYLVLV